MKKGHQKIKWQGRLYTFFVCTILANIGLALILKVFNDNIIFYYSPTEITSKDLSKIKAPFRVGGLVKEGTIKKLDSETIEFIVTDLNKELKVKYSGVLPNLFKELQGTIVLGHIDKEQVFIATEILAKHDENYMPKEVADSLKQSGRWQE